jgi:hypothetical protein
MLRPSTNWYKPRTIRPLPDAIAYKHVYDARFDDPLEYPLEVLLPVREVVFDTRIEPNDFNTYALGRIDPRHFMKDTDFQITYSFSTRRRVNNPLRLLGGEYGAPDVTFRQLYDFLCTVYNKGERFIDTYFQRVFPTSPAGRLFASFEDTMRDAINEEWLDRYMAVSEKWPTKSGRLRKATEKKLLREFSVWKSSIVAVTLRGFDRHIRQEIIAKLSAGLIPLNHANRLATKRARMEMGLKGEPEFFATGQLIRDIQLDIRVPEDAFAW